MIFQRNTFVQVERFRLKATKLRELNFLFLEKSESQRKGNSILIALSDLPPMWGSQNDMLQ